MRPEAHQVGGMFVAIRSRSDGWSQVRRGASISYLGPTKSGPKPLILRQSRWIFRNPPKAEVTGSNPVGRAKIATMQDETGHSVRRHVGFR